MELGVFLPIGNNGWIISTTSPQYMPTFDVHDQAARAFGGPS
jgi:pyrimidine oxygenase